MWTQRLLGFLGLAPLAASLLLIATPQESRAQDPVVMNWARTDYPAGVEQYRYSQVISLPGGDILVGGYSQSGFAVTTRRGIVRRFNQNGVVVWEKTLSATPAAPQLEVQQMALLPNGSIYLTGIGQRGYIARLDAATGNTQLSYTINEPTTSSAIAPDFTCYFASFRPRTVTNFVDASNYSDQVFHDFASHRISNALVQTTTMITVGNEHTGKTFGQSVLRQQQTPAVQFSFTPTGAFMLAAAKFNIDNDATNQFGGGILMGVIAYNSTGGVVYQTTKSNYYDVSGNVDVATLSGITMNFGTNVAFQPQFNYNLIVENPATMQKRNALEATLFDATTGTTSTQSNPPNPYNSYRDANGIRWFYGLTALKDTSYIARSVTNSTTNVQWSTVGQGIAWLPFQTIRAATSNAKLQINRINDTNGSSNGDFEFAVAPYRVTAAVQNEQNGDLIVVGSKIVVSGKEGAWIGRFSQAPIANGNTYTTPRNTVLNAASVLTNDRFAGSLAPTVLTQPSNGTLVMNSDGTFAYTPKNNYVGSDSFTYRIVRPGILVFSTATVFITITP